MMAVQPTNTEQASVLAVLVTGWRAQLSRGDSLALVPAEVLEAGSQDVQSFFKSLQHGGASYRKKLCVIGPSNSGKTSLIKTLMSNKATRERADTRTIGIDRHSWTFEIPAIASSLSRVYEVSVWDFAGQDEYQSTHTMFYSKRTLYAVCVNVKKYHDRVKSCKIVSSGQVNDTMDAFFDEKVYSRIRAVCAREPESEFVFVGTKLDLVGGKEECVRRVGDDVLARFARRSADDLRVLDRMIDGLKMDQQPKLVSQKFVAMSSADTMGLAALREELQKCIHSSDSAFLMPSMYAKVERYLRKMVREANANPSLTERITDIFVKPEDLTKKLLDDSEFSELSEKDVASISRVLHKLGDILWFYRSGGDLKNVVFLSPDLVIDFVRKMINHELEEGRPTCLSFVGSPRPRTALERAVVKEGRVAHKLLTSLELWCGVKDDKLMLQLKELLFHFQLAYPAGTKRLQVDSDLIAPIYWNKNNKIKSIPTPPRALTATTMWDYDFPNGLPDSLFDRLGVASYSAIYSNERFFSRDTFGTHCDQYFAQVTKRSENIEGSGGACSTLRIRIVAVSQELAAAELVRHES